MKSRALSNFLLILFVIGSLASAYMLYSLPGMIEEGSADVSRETVNELSQVFLQVNVILGATVFIGILCVFMLSQRVNDNKVVEKIVYVDKGSANKEAEQQMKEGDIDIENKFREIEAQVKQKKSFSTKCEALINALCQKIEASQGIFYQTVHSGSKRQIQMVASYAFSLPDSESLVFEFGEGLAGQAAKEGKSMKIDEIPDGYIKIVSGLGASSPSHLMVKPVFLNGEVEAVVEVASFKAFSVSEENLIDKSVSLLESEIGKEKGKKTEEKPPKKEENTSGKNR